MEGRRDEFLDQSWSIWQKEYEGDDEQTCGPGISFIAELIAWSFCTEEEPASGFWGLAGGTGCKGMSVGCMQVVSVKSIT